MAEFERITSESVMEALGLSAEQAEDFTTYTNEQFDLQIDLMKNDPKELKRRQQGAIDFSEENDRRVAAEGKITILQEAA